MSTKPKAKEILRTYHKTLDALEKEYVGNPIMRQFPETIYWFNKVKEEQHKDRTTSRSQIYWLKNKAALFVLSLIPSVSEYAKQMGKEISVMQATEKKYNLVQNSLEKQLFAVAQLDETLINKLGNKEQFPQVISQAFGEQPYADLFVRADVENLSENYQTAQRIWNIANSIPPKTPIPNISQEAFNALIAKNTILRSALLNGKLPDQ